MRAARLLPSPPRSGGRRCPGGADEGAFGCRSASQSVVNRAFPAGAKSPLTRRFAPPSPTLARGEGSNKSGAKRRLATELSLDPTHYSPFTTHPLRISEAVEPVSAGTGEAQRHRLAASRR